MSTPYQSHCKRWRTCRKCKLHECRSKVVLVRGRLPAPVLFVGEAPGVSEDLLGIPFIGPAGKLLDHIIGMSIGDRCKFAVTNLVGCIPKEHGKGKAAEPPDWAITSCKDRLHELAAMCRPKLVVCLGKVASKWLPKLLDTGDWNTINIVHPAAILRASVVQQGVAIQRAVVIVRDAVDDIL